MSAPAGGGALLIVNADDYGYFRCVSRGILRAAESGIVTATGVFATAPHIDEQAAWLRDHPELDAGVHLNLTDGTPLTEGMRRKLSRWSGRFPRKFAIAAAILTRAVDASDVALEWRAQIERCLAAGLTLRFLNSHEHLHMLPPLFDVATTLAADFGIGHVRRVVARGVIAQSPQATLRNLVMKPLALASRGRTRHPATRFLGLECSGKLNLGDLERCVSQMEPGQVYELMCHPGEYDAREVDDPRLVAYHDWAGELRTLTSPQAREVIEKRGHRLIRYRDLDGVDGPPSPGQPAARPQSAPDA